MTSIFGTFNGEMETTGALTDVMGKLEAYFPEKSLRHELYDQLDTVAQERRGSIAEVDKVRFESSVQYFKDVDPDNGIRPLDKIAEVYGLLPEGTDRKVIIEHATELLRLALEQQYENPLEFLSHGFDHTMNVFQYTEEILKQNPEILERMAVKYKLTPEMARFMLLNVTLFHDVGYPLVHGRGKSVHSLIGADLVATERMRGLYKKILNLPDKGQEELLNDFSKAILYHNADSRDALYGTKIVTDRGDLLITDPLDVEKTRGVFADRNIQEVVVGKYIGRPLDAEKKGDKALGLEYIEVDVLDDPLSLIRYADNMDFTKKRFHGVQREPAFKECYRRFGDTRYVEAQLLVRLEEGDKSAIEEVLRELPPERHPAEHTIEDVMRAWKQHIIDSVMQDEQYKDLSPQVREQIMKEVPHLDSEELRHWGGSDVVEEVSLHGSVLKIVVNAKKYGEFEKIPVLERQADEHGNQFEVKTHVGMYQILRAHRAFDSLKMGKRKIRLIVEDTEGHLIHIPGITEHLEPS